MTVNELLGPEWAKELQPVVESPYFAGLLRFLKDERSRHEVIPPKGSPLLFYAFRTTPPSKTKVVILGQDPYHDGESYDGFAFSNPDYKWRPSPSLRNILLEVERDVYGGFSLQSRSDFGLKRWADQGVLLINTAHTVVKGRPGSHTDWWYPFTVGVVKVLQKQQGLVWMLWGRHAEGFKEHITSPNHTVLVCGHPSPLNTSNPFSGCGCFSECNRELEARLKEKIIW